MIHFENDAIADYFLSLDDEEFISMLTDPLFQYNNTFNPDVVVWDGEQCVEVEVE